AAMRFTLLLVSLSAAAVAAAVQGNTFPRNGIPQLQDTRIVGGVEATPGEFPYQVSIQHEGVFGRSHMCGGSVVNTNYVVTAAHCLHDQTPDKLYVVAGEFDMKVDSGDEQVIQASELITHEEFNFTLLYNDIALIKLSSPLSMNDMVAPVVLPQQMEQVMNGTMCTVTGWGYNHEHGSMMNFLMKVDVPVVDDSKCHLMYGPSAIIDSMLCAGVDEGGKDACQGDSGGPMVCEGVLHGIVSWGYGCARPLYPGVYTEVAYYREWIDQHSIT
ncbi:unnamed protein product, partial [Meganyctiphanes norvegica]